MRMETTINAGNLHALIEAVQAERDAWRSGLSNWLLEASGRLDQRQPHPRLLQPCFFPSGRPRRSRHRKACGGQARDDRRSPGQFPAGRP
ncbi:hypothetical protein FV242_30475 [Methylobacterium sp. WL64]|nr:hypothetical protein FV242_30475 [Methylobacterium sp. WL64]